MDEERTIQFAELTEGDSFGEMVIIERTVRAATVSALGDARVLTVDKIAFLRRVHEGSSLASRIVEKISAEIRESD